MALDKLANVNAPSNPAKEYTGFIDTHLADCDYSS